MRGVEWVAGQRLAPAGGELDRIGLAQDQRAARAHDGHRSRVAAGLHALMQRRILGGRHVLGIEHVLDAPGNSVERARTRRFVELAGRAQRLRRIKMQPGTDNGIARLDPGQAGPKQFLGRELAGVQQDSGFRRGELERLRCDSGG